MVGKLLLGGAIVIAGGVAGGLAARALGRRYPARSSSIAAPSGGCSLRTTLGRRLKDVPGSGPYEVCLSPTQRQALFGKAKPGMPLGCGTFACVWPGRKDGQLVKITRDREDVEGLQAAQGMDRVVKVFDARELPNAGVDLRTKKRIPVYAIVVERLRPLSKTEQHSLEVPLERARLTVLKRADRHRGSPVTFRIPREDYPALTARACERTPGKGCEKFASSFFDTWAEMFRRGIIWQDAHVGNVAIDKAGRWKAIDLGFSGTKKHTDVPLLHGARWR